MKRQFFALVLIAYLMAFTAPFVAGADDSTTAATWTNDDLCKNGHSYPLTSSDSNASNDEAYAAFLETEEKSITYSKDTCGKENASTGYLEKGDCSAAGKIVTEISEPLAPTVKLNEDNYVITVYAGTCCKTYYAPDPVNHPNDYICQDIRNIYSTDLNTCANENDACQARQWIIASSGTSLLKLFVKQVYTWGAVAIGSIAVSMIVFHGIKISISGVSGDISDSKNRILQAIAGIVLFFLASLILSTINPDFFG